jgi:threonine/homoserine efflux transporter RhtA
VLEWLQTTQYSQWVRESWGWALALTVHAFGNAIVVGLVLIMAMRLFGLFRTIPYTALPKLFPYIWVAICFQVASGFTLWMSKPARYVKDGVFDIKFSLVVIGIVLLVYFQRTITQESPDWQKAGKVTSKGLRFAAAAALCWAFVIIMGRLTAYLGSLYVA